jgi:hypothetical protein
VWSVSLLSATGGVVVLMVGGVGGVGVGGGGVWDVGVCPGMA